jgi:ribosomal protein S18 acetylase RimI-like enzyme
VAERDGLIAGMYHRQSDTLHAIHVHVLYIGGGVGRALMEHAEGAGARRLEVRAFNSRARAFYERRGWRAVAEMEDSEMGTPVRTILMELG